MTKATRKQPNTHTYRYTDGNTRLVGIKKARLPGYPENPAENSMIKKTAATYSPAASSTIGADGLNFSVRDGKRWNPDAIATLTDVDTHGTQA